MVNIKDLLAKEIENLNDEQLKQVSDFIAFLKYRNYAAKLPIEKSQAITIHSEFARSDRQLSEVRFEEYSEFIRQEDLK